MRVRLPQRPGSFGHVATVIGETGAILGAIDLVRVEKGMKIRDIASAVATAVAEAAQASGVARRPRRPARTSTSR
jgi:hypothetical protein